MDLFDRIKLAMKAAGMRQADLAVAIGKSAATVSLWGSPDPERRTRPSEATLMAVAKATGTTVGWLREGVGAPPEVRAEQIEGPARMRRSRIHAIRDAVKKLLTSSGRKDRRGQFDVEVMPPGHELPYDFFYLDGEIALSVLVVTPNTLSRYMGDARGEVVKLWVLREMDAQMQNPRKRYALAVVPPTDDDKLRWDQTPAFRLQQREAEAMGIEVHYAASAGAVYALLFPDALPKKAA